MTCAENELRQAIQRLGVIRSVASEMLYGGQDIDATRFLASEIIAMTRICEGMVENATLLLGKERQGT